MKRRFILADHLVVLQYYGKKTLNKYCSIINYDCDRILGLQFTCGSFTAHFLCVYLPYECSDNHDDYMFYLAKIFQIIDEFQSPYIFVCGDFNANIRESLE